MVVGRCWRPLTATVPGFQPLPEQEAPALRASAVTWLDPDQARVPTAVQAALQRLADAADVVHVHVDLDVHDPAIAPANGYAAPNGLTAHEVHEIVRQLASRLPLVSGTLASYDPTYDPAGRMRDTALDLLALLAELATPSTNT